MIDYGKYVSNNRDEKWHKFFEELQKFVAREKRLPKESDEKGEFEKLTKWFKNQKKNYALCKQIMANDAIRAEWQSFTKQYSNLFVSNEEAWLNALMSLQQYIDNEKKLPSTIDKNDNVKKLAKWYGHQKDNYKSQSDIMKNIEIKLKWEEFLHVNKDFVFDRKQLWQKKLNELKDFMDTENKIPKVKSTSDIERKLANWIGMQKKHIKIPLK